MPFEYLSVLFPTRRRVKINGTFQGRTNQLIEIEGGHYEVTLGPPDNFTPARIEVDLRGTTAFTPRTVIFEQKQENDQKR